MEYIRKRITRAQSKKEMEKKEEEKKVKEDELDAKNDKADKEKENDKGCDEKEKESAGDNEENPEQVEGKEEEINQRDLENVVGGKGKSKKIKKKKEIFTVGVRSGCKFIVRTHGIIRRVLKQYKCSLCTAIFQRVKDRNEHVRVIHDINSFKCPECDKNFKMESSMK